MQTLAHTINNFRGVTIDPEQLPSDPQAFEQRLAYSLVEWQAAGLKLVWLEVPVEKARLIPVATEAGFTFHHSHERTLMMTYRLQPDALVPGYATHCIGAGGVVLNPE